MKILSTETEPDEEAFFKAALTGHDLRFAHDISETDDAAEVLSIFIRSRIDAGVLDAHPGVKLIATRSAGYDHIDVTECARRGVTVCEVPGSNANTVAEH